MSDAATQMDIQNLREDIAVLRSDVRDNHNRHSDADDRRFSDVHGSISEINKHIAEWTGALRISKWTLGICLPLILVAALTHLLRHWNG